MVGDRGEVLQLDRPHRAWPHEGPQRPGDVLYLLRWEVAEAEAANEDQVVGGGGLDRCGQPRQPTEVVMVLSDSEVADDIVPGPQPPASGRSGDGRVVLER